MASSEARSQSRLEQSPGGRSDPVNHYVVATLPRLRHAQSEIVQRVIEQKRRVVLQERSYEIHRTEP